MVLKDSIPDTPERNPLVSLIILTYNSADFILETLESAKEQSYKNIELIISDDCSSDATTTICENWLIDNKQYFKNTQLIVPASNTGIPANCNRGIKASNGQWLKFLAGDDVFFPNCVQSCIDFVNKHSEVKFLFSKVAYLTNDKESKYLETKTDIDMVFFNSTPKNQYDMLVKGGVYVPAPTEFLNKQTLLELGMFDEEIKLCEDYPMWMKATKNNVKLFFMSSETIWYRIHEQSVMSSRSLLYEKSMKTVFFKYRFKYLLKKQPLKAINLFFINISRTNRFWSKAVNLLLPSTYITWFKTKLQ
ncbi:glycosyltransferase [Mariniflexile litorale]|uniref:Glycosyltransferase n=1 Tax=Mariniflexile litorale TaxID=3045158 RepID=A0AAU7EEA4_9FLAO|nr:glycosyltransferase [Mariniflexile sp. KMM 9835]MDQ8211506.1 glycosyltransferase [Mariniflexile sp. KMM 9835]